VGNHTKLDKLRAVKDQGEKAPPEKVMVEGLGVGEGTCNSAASPKIHLTPLKRLRGCLFNRGSSKK
jgi:hypothetical protein